MTITYRAEKGAPLTAAELDGNFRELEERLHHLENDSETPESIRLINLENESLSIKGSYGTDYGNFPLPKISLPFRGGWNTQTLYHKQDIITQETGIYECLQSHTSFEWNQEGHQWKSLIPFHKAKNMTLPLFEKETLPKEETLGKFAFLLEEGTCSPIFFNGKCWQYLTKGNSL
jgi:hypothetical protein